MSSLAAPPLRFVRSRRVRSSLALALIATGMCCPALARASPQPGLIVVPRPSSRVALSYFKLRARPGRVVHAGAIELRNPGTSRIRVGLAAVDGQTLSTLGSGYASPGSKAGRATRWLLLARHLLTLAPHQRALVGVSVKVPRHAVAGDYLSGVSIEALDQTGASTPRKGLSIASANRYVIGAEVSIPGPRHPRIRFTGAQLERQPAGLTFLLAARNPGNVILQHVHGKALVTSGPRTVAAIPLGPGTFVTGTSIAYPIPIPRERSREGTTYRVRAYLRYRGGIASLDTLVRAGAGAAAPSDSLGGARNTAPSAESGPPVWLAAVIAVPAVLVLWFGLLFVRRRHGSVRATAKTLEAALAASADSGAPLALISVVPLDDEAVRGGLLAVLRSRLRHADRLCRLAAGGFLVVAADTDEDTAEALAGDLRRHLERVHDGAQAVAVQVYSADRQDTAAELLGRIEQANRDTHVLTPSG